MRSSLALSLCLGLASANIIFTHVPLSCDPNTAGHVDGKTGCLRGQLCLDNGTCKRDLESELYPMSFRRASTPIEKRAFSTNGQCGPSNGGLLCDPNSTVYKGTCCSQYGWCGNDAAHCGTGCVSGCTGGSAATSSASGSQPSSSTTPRSDGRCGTGFGGATCDPNGPYGGCCSSAGWCGSTTAHCLPANGCQSGCTGSSPTSSSSASAPTSTAKVTTDGTCGAANGNTVCGNWPQGSCCSMYGFCGNTDAHCGAGCQSGPCLSAPVQQAPGPSPAPANPNPGSFKVVGQAGVPAMHAGLMTNGRVFFLDKIENYTQIKLSDGQYAYSSEYDPVTNTAVGLQYKTNAFCSGGQFLADGRVISVGGNGPLTFIDPTVGDGFNAIRYLARSKDTASLNGQPWSEPGNKLASDRWYPSAQIMPDGRIFVASGSLNGLDPTVKSNNNPTYEILSATGVSQGVSTNMDILVNNQPYYMYPFIHLMRDGNMFVFVSKSSQSFNAATGTVNNAYPDLPGDYRTYPNTGGSVMLPLTSANNWNPDIIICGGGAYQDITSPTDPSCGRIQPLSTNPSWEMDSMPIGRVMVEGTLLPDGTVLFCNGGNRGAQGFGLAADPTGQMLIYNPTQPLGQRWTTGASTNIARLYHSVTILLLDGTLMIAGSNPVQMPVLTPVPNQTPSEDYVTEFRVENYVPPYLSGTNAARRPTNMVLSSKALKVGTTFTITFNTVAGAKAVKVALYHGGYITHSVHMGQRLAFLDNTGFVASTTARAQKITVTMPPNNNVAPPHPYVVYVVVDGVPSVGQFVMVS